MGGEGSGGEDDRKRSKEKIMGETRIYQVAHQDAVYRVAHREAIHRDVYEVVD